MYTDEELRTILSANAERSWQAVPADCPTEIRSRIIDYRAKKLGIYRDPAVEAVRARLASQAQIPASL